MRTEQEARGGDWRPEKRVLPAAAAIEAVGATVRIKGR